MTTDGRTVTLPDTLQRDLEVAGRRLRDANAAMIAADRNAARVLQAVPPLGMAQAARTLGISRFAAYRLRERGQQ